MSEHRNTEVHVKRKLPLIHILIAFLIILSAAGPAALPAVSAAQAHPLITRLAAEAPGQRISVIAQSSAPGIDLSAIVERLGGKVTHDLRFIQAVAAEMDAAAALQLARMNGVRWVSPDAPVEEAGTLPGNTAVTAACTTNPFLDSMDAPEVWGMGLKGQTIRVAVVDSGVQQDADLPTPVVNKGFITNVSYNLNDNYGHGTHVAGILGGRGVDSNGVYKGVAPGVEIISLKVSNYTGMANESDVVGALQWVYENKSQYNIRVVNLSLNSTTESSYHQSPLNAAVEILWFNGVVVVASAGNSGSTYNTIRSAPANDPFIITVGATNNACTANTNDDTMASFSKYGYTLDGFLKPDILAPGQDIVSVLSSSSKWDEDYAYRVVQNGQYFRLSGTSMAAPMVAGTVALLLQDEPNLTPDQVKYRLTHAAGAIKISRTVSFPVVNAYKAVTGTSHESANTGLMPNALLYTGSAPLNSSVSWNSVSWNSVSWNSVSWNSVSWNSVSWNSVYFGK
jgi:serine protease AprX